MNLFQRFHRSCQRTLLLLAGMTGMAFGQIAGCDNQEVTNTLLDGLQDLVITLIEALFIAIRPTESSGGPVTTWLIDTVRVMIA